MPKEIHKKERNMKEKDKGKNKRKPKHERPTGLKRKAQMKGYRPEQGRTRPRERKGTNKHK